MQARTHSIAGVQVAHQQGTRQENIARASAMIRAAPDHDLYVLPELASSGYGPVAFAQLYRLAEPRMGPVSKLFPPLHGNCKHIFATASPAKPALQNPPSPVPW